jgi:hypothetical protein
MRVVRRLVREHKHPGEQSMAFSTNHFYNVSIGRYRYLFVMFSDVWGKWNQRQHQVEEIMHNFFALALGEYGAVVYAATPEADGGGAYHYMTNKDWPADVRQYFQSTIRSIFVAIVDKDVGDFDPSHDRYLLLRLPETDEDENTLRFLREISAQVRAGADLFRWWAQLEKEVVRAESLDATDACRLGVFGTEVASGTPVGTAQRVVSARVAERTSEHPKSLGTVLSSAPLDIKANAPGERAAQPTGPRVLISYAWEDGGYKDLVARFAARLRQDGINVRLDQWDLDSRPFTNFMNAEVRLADRLLVLCSPSYKTNVEAMEEGRRMTGSGWEMMLFASGLATNYESRHKLLVVLARGDSEQSVPSFLNSIYRITLKLDKPFDEAAYEHLLRCLTDRLPVRPPLGTVPDLPVAAITPLSGTK